MSDALALSWLDRLLDLDDARRAEQLQQIAIDDPALHARLQRLLTAALSNDDSQLLAPRIIAGLRSVRESATAALEAQQTFVGYRLIRELGRGGMSVVWLAERADGVVKRQVALKLPLFLLSTPIEIERIAREKDVLAALSHPNIARLYDAGVAPSGQPFIVLEFVDGMPITDYCDHHRLSLADRLRLFLQVLAAVDHAHKHLVVHRDLKPSNIMVDTQGQVKLLDFGIAKMMDDSPAKAMLTQLTLQGNSLMTPLYGAPEQVTGQPISTGTDVYVLGVVLCELLSGARPFANVVGEAPPLARVVEALLHSNPARPSQCAVSEDAAHLRSLPTLRRMQQELSGDIDTIVLKAMRRAPGQRYGSVSALAEDIHRFLGHLPIAARPQSIWYSMRLLFRRHRATSAAAAFGAVLSIIGAAIAIQQYRESRIHEARTAAVRDFMFALVNDVEPTETQSNLPITGKQMVDGAVRRARQSFTDKPQLQGELLSELGRMYVRLGEPELARQTLAEALPILESSAPSHDAALNKTRAQLADMLLKHNELARARILAVAARNACTRDDSECAKARAYANTVLSSINRVEGLPEQSLLAMREAVRDTAIGFGEQHPETAMALRSLAVVARNSGRLQEASAATERALLIAANQTLRAADRDNLSRTVAILDLDLGRYELARKRLTELLTQITNRNMRALQLRLLANVLLAQGEAQASLANSESAIALADATQMDPELLFARQVHAQALALLGKTDLALEEIQQVMDGLRELGRSDNAPEVLRVHRIRGEILLRARRTQESFTELESLSTRLFAMPQLSELELGQTLDLLGCALRELNRWNEAVALHDKARIQLQKQLPEDHPFLLRNTLYREAGSKNRAEFERAADRLKQTLTVTSVWRQVIDAQRDSAICPNIGTSICVLVL